MSTHRRRLIQGGLALILAAPAALLASTSRAQDSTPRQSGPDHPPRREAGPGDRRQAREHRAPRHQEQHQGRRVEGERRHERMTGDEREQARARRARHRDGHNEHRRHRGRGEGAI